MPVMETVAVPVAPPLHTTGELEVVSTMLLAEALMLAVSRTVTFVPLQFV